MRDRERAGFIDYTILSALALLVSLPILWIILSAFKDPTDLYKVPPSIMPKNFTLNNFKSVLQKGDFTLFFFNTLFVTVTSTIITVLINTMAGFALAKYKFKSRDTIMLIFLSTLIIPLEVIMSPIFIVISKMGLYNNLWGLIIPAAATPTGVFIMRQYLLSVPDALLDAARIDGASELKIFWSIILPIAKPAMAILAIFSFMWRWNDFLWPLIVISDPKKYTLQLAISNFMGEFNVDWTSLLSMSVLSMIPVLIIFIMFQKHFTKGLVTSGMKE